MENVWGLDQCSDMDCQWCGIGIFWRLDQKSCPSQSCTAPSGSAWNLYGSPMVFA